VAADAIATPAAITVTVTVTDPDTAYAAGTPSRLAFTTR
jgi:hypothetical protein